MINTPKEVQLTKEWIDKFVVGLSLCPFAKFSVESDSVLFKISSSKNLKQCLEDLVRFILVLTREEEMFYSNGFLIMDENLTFFFLLDLKDNLDNFLAESEYVGMFQTVVFHPHFQFADEDFGAHGNFTNRSPLPMIHILRVDEVSQAIENFENVDDIPIRNNTILNELGIENVSEVFEDDFVDRTQNLVSK